MNCPSSETTAQPKMSPVEGLRVLMFVQRLWGVRVGHKIAKRLFDKGARIAAFVEKRPTLEFVNAQTDVTYEYILSYEEIMNEPDRFVDDDVSLDRICEDLGIDSIWPLATTEHNLARSYTGRYYYEDIQNKDDNFIISYMKALYCQVRRLFSVFQPNVVVSPNYVAPNHLIVEKLASRYGIRMIGVTHTRIKGIYSFSYDYKDSDGPFVRRIKDLQGRRSNSDNANEASTYIEGMRNFYSQPLYHERMKITNTFDLINKAKYGVMESIRYFLNGGVNPMANVGPTPDNRPPRYLIRDFFMEWKCRREMMRFEYTPMKCLGRFAYFPLQVQPEAQIDTVAAYFNNQSEIARLTAKSLPGDMTLAVKEHPGMLGKRGHRFYDVLAKTPNVKVVDYRADPQNCCGFATLLLGL